MILYQLRCSSNHEFEAWFRDSAAYDSQIKAGVVTCPVCNDKSISKAIMSPNISKTRSNSASDIKVEKERKQAEASFEKALQVLERVREHVEKNCDDVGEDFAEEARKIHYGESKKRGIYGQASYKETVELDDEGIEFYKIPSRPRRNS